MQRRTTLVLLVLLVMALAACAPGAAATPAAGSSTTSSPSDVARLNLNEVTGDELLATIPSFPNRMVREFQEYRPYVSIQQFRREIGKYVGEAQVAEWEKYVYVPISINESDAATLQQIPGLDAAETETLMAGRPYASTEDFLTKLGGLIPADKLDIAKTYLGEN